MGVQVGEDNGADKYKDKTGNRKVFVEFEGFYFLMWAGYHTLVLKYEFSAVITAG